MIKVIWFLKRAEHLSLEEFSRWWLERHALDIVAAKGPHLMRYVINVRLAEDVFPGKTQSPSDWDGCAEQWFATEADFRAAFDDSVPSPTRADTLRHVSRLERLIVREHEIPLGQEGR